MHSSNRWTAPVTVSLDEAYDWESPDCMRFAAPIKRSAQRKRAHRRDWGSLQTPGLEINLRWRSFHKKCTSHPQLFHNRFGVHLKLHAQSTAYGRARGG